MQKVFGRYIRKKRLALLAKDSTYSLRQVADKIGVEPSFLSKVERCLTPPPSEARIVALAEALGEDADLLLGLAGRVSSDVQKTIIKRPMLFAQLVRQLKNAPNTGVSNMVKEARAKYGSG